MSYGGDPRWVSLYTWLALGREYGWDLTGRGAAPASGRGLAAVPWTSLSVQRQPEGEAPAVYGQIDPVNGLTLFGFPFLAQVLPETVTAAGSGYRVELRDTAGQRSEEHTSELQSL